MVSLGLFAQLACIWEATARKPGNVHRGLDFEDVGYVDFLQSAAAIGPVIESSSTRRVGETILQGIIATRTAVKTNTNLGILLLLAPLAHVPEATGLREGIGSVLADLQVADSVDVYKAIRLAHPGGMGKADSQDIHDEPTESLQAVMAMAADRDMVARQYASGFADVFGEGSVWLKQSLAQASSLEEAIVRCHLMWMAAFPDSLIARKRGPLEAVESARRAELVLAADWPRTRAGRVLLRDLDGWLREVGHARNPGTSADLVTACLFAALREGTITVPLSLPWSSGFDYD